MGRQRRRGTGRAQGAKPLHPVMQQAISNGARLEHGLFEVTPVPNPHGEVVVRGEIRPHEAVRRVPRFETLYRSRVIDRVVFTVLEWYAARLALAKSGLYRSALDTTGRGGGSPFAHLPAGAAAISAREDIDWARGFIPADLRAAFDGVMEQEESFAAIAARLYPWLSPDSGQRRVSVEFKLAANYLLKGAGPRVLGAAVA